MNSVRTFVLVALGAIAVSVGLTACGGGSSDSSTTTLTSSSISLPSSVQVVSAH